MKDSFIKAGIMTFDRFVFISFKQQKAEWLESFYGRLIEQAEKCSLVDEETTLTWDTFVFNMLDLETQQEIQIETVSPTKPPEITIHMEMRAQNRQISTKT